MLTVQVIGHDVVRVIAVRHRFLAARSIAVAPAV